MRNQNSVFSERVAVHIELADPRASVPYLRQTTTMSITPSLRAAARSAYRDLWRAARTTFSGVSFSLNLGRHFLSYSRR